MSSPALVNVSRLAACGCCGGIRAETPAAVGNRPGLSAIAYRVGGHAQFKDSMLAALSDSMRSPLKALRSRDDDDFSIALLDATATMADVLSFYQERIASESYLRTATERRSVLELARLIGYELRPGVAAGTFLAFNLDEATGAPKQLTVATGTKVQSVPAQGETPQTFETLEPIMAKVEWNAMKAQATVPGVPQYGNTSAYLAGVASNLKPGDWLLFVGAEREQPPGNQPASERWDVRRVSKVTPDFTLARTVVEWDRALGSVPPESTLPSAAATIYALRVRAALFGSNAPQPATLSNDTLAHYNNQRYDRDWPFTVSGKGVDLDTTYPGILPQSWIVLSRPGFTGLYRVVGVRETGRTAFTLTGRVTHCIFDTSEHVARFSGANLRRTMVLAQSEALPPAEYPILPPTISGSSVKLAQAPSGLVRGQKLLAKGFDKATGEAISEFTSVSSVSGTTVQLDPPLRQTYRIETFTLNANVARATHGESVQEVLGAGDAAAAFQTFALKQPPLTYVSAANPSGAASTLEVRVNDLQWREVPTLFGNGPLDRVFVSRRDDAGNTAVQFGDGTTGARLPSGRLNVRARYRKGIGAGGNLKADQLSLLLSRPPGLKTVTNAKATGGAQDPEQLADARTNAPVTVLTLGRAVSLTDYEDFARGFGGIAKAFATWFWDGYTRQILVTVAGPGGSVIDPASATYGNLLAALRGAGDPFVPIRLASMVPATFRFGGAVKVEPDYEAGPVLAAVESALRSAYAFESRSFGQPVYLSEVVERVQSIAGVLALQVTRLYRPDQQGPQVNQRLLAAPPTQAGGTTVGAELLTLNTGPLDALGVL